MFIAYTRIISNIQDNPKRERLMAKKSKTGKIHADTVSQTLCLRVAGLRKKQELTLEQLASASGVSRSMLSQIERGQANPTLAVTYRIA